MTSCLRSRWVAAGAIGLLAAAVADCGKKGPPLAPLLHLPGPVEGFSARRLGSIVYVQFTVPRKNQDNSTPADLSRIDVYGFTGTPTDDDEVVKYGTLVARIPVRRPLPPEEESARGKEKGEPPRQVGTPRRPPKPKSKPVEPEPGFDQGATVSVTETLTPALVEPVVVAKRAREKKTAAKTEAPVFPPSASTVALPWRVYVAVGVNRKGQRGSFSPHATVPLLEAPGVPRELHLSHTETAITLEWAPPPDAPPVKKQEGEPPVPATPLPPRGAPTWSYQVYEVAPVRPAEGVPAAPPALPQVTPPAPLNPQPLGTTTFSDSRIEFGAERCYTVRAVRSFGTTQEESESSEVACITPRDIYPPAAPKGLTAVVNAGAISLIWDPNTEADLDGYLVLRAESPSGTLQPVTREPIHQTTFNDTTVKPGVRYVYAIVAVDKAGNASPQSDRVEETAR